MAKVAECGIGQLSDGRTSKSVVYHPPKEDTLIVSSPVKRFLSANDMLPKSKKPITDNKNDSA